MSDINPQDVKETLGIAHYLAAFVGGIISGILALGAKVYRVARRFEDVERKVDEHVEATQKLTARVETLETVLPHLMDRTGVEAIFNKQVEMLGIMEARLRQEFGAQHKHIVDRMDDLKGDLTEVNKNLFALVSRDRNSRIGDP